MTLLDWLPDTIAMGHLHRTWLYWLLLVFLISEQIWVMPQVSRAVRRHKVNQQTAPGPWGASPVFSKAQIASGWLQTVGAIGLITALILGSAFAFYLCLISFVPRIINLIEHFPKAKGGAEIGSAIGSFVGGSAQVVLILFSIASVDPTSQFPLRWDGHTAP